MDIVILLLSLCFFPPSDASQLQKQIKVSKLILSPNNSLSLSLSLSLTDMAAAQVSASLSVSARDFCAVVGLPRTSVVPRVRLPGRGPSGATFATGSPLAVRRSSSIRKSASKAAVVSIRCEQNTQGGNSLDVWLGRLAMVGFAAAISVEIGTGKGLLENFGLTSPLPTVALAVTALVGVLTAVFIFQSASSK